MPKTNFQMVDLATGRAASGAKLRIAEDERQHLIEQACEIIHEISDVEPSWFKPGSEKAKGSHLLTVLANGEPISGLYYRVKKDEVTGKRYVSFHHASAQDKIVKGLFVKAKSQTPGRSLFSWMLRSIGKGAILFPIGSTPKGMDFLRKLERERVLKQTASGYREEFVPTGKKMPRLKIRRKIRRMG